MSKVVYICRRTDGAHKIGVSDLPTRRMVELARSLDKKPVLLEEFSHPKISAYHVERQAHKILSEKRDSGEWFFVSLEEAICAIRSATEYIEQNYESFMAAKFHRPHIKDGFVQRTIIIPKALEAKVQALADKNDRSFSAETRQALEAHVGRK